MDGVALYLEEQCRAQIGSQSRHEVDEQVHYRGCHRLYTASAHRGPFTLHSLEMAACRGFIPRSL